MRYDYVILGAGITGMSCAQRLKQIDPNLKILVLEQKPMSGGLSRSIRYKNWLLDLGPHRLYTPYPEVEKHLKQLLGEDLLTVERSSAMYLHGKFVNYPFQMGDLMFSLSPRRAVEYFSSFLYQKVKDLHLPSNATRKILRDFSYTGYLNNRFGEKIARDVFYPYAEKVWGLKPENLSSWILKKRVSSPHLGALINSLFNPKKKKALVREDFYYPQNGMQQLIDFIEKKCRTKNVEFIFNQKVSFLKRTEQHWEIVTSDEKYQSQRVISTIPVTDMVKLTKSRFLNDDKKLLQSFQTLSFRKIFFVYVFLSLPPENFKTWYYFPDKDLVFSRISNLKLFSDKVSPENTTVLCCEIPMKMDEVPHPEIAEFVVRDLERIGMIRKEQVEETFCHSEPYCYPVYDLIFEAKLKIIFRYLARLTNLVCTGRQGLFHHNNIDHAILMGWATADFCNNSGFIVDLSSWYFKKILEFEEFRIID